MGAASAIAAAPSGVANAPETSAIPSELAIQFDKSPDTVVADVNASPITLGMVADRLHELPEKFAILPSHLIYNAAVADLIQQRAMAIKPSFPFDDGANY